jgi:cytochrome c-type biogenesis protein CcmE
LQSSSPFPDRQDARHGQVLLPEHALFIEGFCVLEVGNLQAHVIALSSVMAGQQENYSENKAMIFEQFHEK